MSKMPPQINDRPLHVLHCVMSLDVGGLERIVVDLARIGKRGGAAISVLCLERLGALAAEATAHGASVSTLNKPPGIVPEMVQRAEEVIAMLKPDIVHTHQLGALWYVGQAARKMGVPVLHTEHIDNVAKTEGRWKKFKYRVLWRRAARYADRFCCVSDDVARSAGRWWTVPRAKIDVVLNGVDVELFADRSKTNSLRGDLGIPNAARVIGSVGRLSEVKRQDLLLRGFARLRASFPDIHLLIVGDGPERGRLVELAAQLGIASATTFAGYQARPERYLQIMDLFALTSRLEGLPLALLEAWAAGLPIVATAVGGVPDLIKHGENGLLIPSGDDEALVLALKTLLENPVKATALAQRGQELVSLRYSLVRMALDYETRYRQLMNLKHQEPLCASSS